LFVGSLEGRKNVEGLIRAYAASGLLAERGVRLRLVGLPQGEGHPLMALARATPGVDVTGFLSAEELAAAYRDCLAFVYPSFCEGFGLPLLEALHHGCVCLSTLTGASPEVACDTALYVNPYNLDEVALGLRRVANLSPEERRRLQERARQRAAHFTWARFHDGLAQVLRKAAE
jgi:glycosyltransferase involved in cell wall biosynthesis